MSRRKNFCGRRLRAIPIAALGISEPGGGSDVAALKTRARTDGDDLVISGQKLWITNGTRADFIILAVRTGGEGYKGVSLVLFPTKTKGFSVGKKLKKVGNMASDTAELFFDECRIPRRNILGEQDKGFYYVMHNFQGERLAAAILALAASEKAVRDALDYGANRKAFGQPIRDFSGVAASLRRASHEYRGGTVAHVSRAGLAQPETKERAGSDHGQAVHV